jgi:hypothetical protein
MMEKIKIKFTDKSELQTFTRLVSDLILLHRYNILYLEYYNATEFLKLLQKKCIDVCFSDRKKFTMQITPNHAHAFNTLVSRECQAPALHAYVLEWNLVTHIHVQTESGYERLSNTHDAHAAKTFTKKFLN